MWLNRYVLDFKRQPHPGNWQDRPVSIRYGTFSAYRISRSATSQIRGIDEAIPNYWQSLGRTGSDDDIGPIFARPQLRTSHSPVNLPSLDSPEWHMLMLMLILTYLILCHTGHVITRRDWAALPCWLFWTLYIVQYIPLIGHIVNGNLENKSPICSGPCTLCAGIWAISPIAAPRQQHILGTPRL